MKYQKIEDHPNFIRDVNSRALINTNQDEYRAALARRDRLKRERLEKESLQNEIRELKMLVSQLINNNNAKQR